MHTFEIGTLYMHKTHWSMVCMLLSDDRFTVTVQNITEDKQFKIPVDHFTRWYSPLRGAHE